MKWGCAILLIVALVSLPSCAQPESAPSSLPASESSLPEPNAEVVPKLNITIVYDNNKYDPRLEAKWGFSCLVEGLGKTILFDTGGDSVTLLGNMEKLEIDPAEINVVVLSHIHGDHVGGLSGFLEENSSVVVYLPQSFPQNLKDEVKALGAEVNQVSEDRKLFEGVYTTGELGNGIKEQSLIIETREELVIVTGCAHPGVTNIIRKAREIVEQDRVFLVMGGFHLTGAPTSQIKSIIEEFRHLDVRKVAPCHCSGKETRELFEKEYGEDYVDSGVGKIIALP
jgi:7,8-dihydropterin-6-yl-methyl-4-(beta-D-ribofuranosyl)aminobenzene 5'-phosphate synthase